MEILRASSWNSQEAQEVRVASLLNVIGKEGMDMYETFQWENSSYALKVDKVLEKFEERCVPVRNETYERYIFFKREQLSDESLDSYITALMKLSESCGFGALRKSLVRDRLILGVKAFSSPVPIVSFSRRRLGTRHEGLWRHTKFEFFDWLVANNEILKRK